LSSVTGYTRYAYALGTDLDLTPLDLLSARAPERHDQISQELRITSSKSGPVEYIGGVYYQQGRLDVDQAFSYDFLTPQIAGVPTYIPLAPYLPLAVNDQFRESTRTESAFGALTWKIARSLQTTAALRYAIVHEDFAQTVGVGTGSAGYGPVVPFPESVAALGGAFAQASGLATVGTLTRSRKDTHFSPSLSLQYHATEGAMLYARYDNGFKAGGFNGADLSGNPATLPFSPEKVDSFEIGAKSILLEGRASFDVDIFRSKYSNLQLAGIVPSTSGRYENRVQNAGGAVSRGVEAEAAVLVTPRLRSALSGGYLDNYYTSYPNATPTASQTLQGVVGQDLAGRVTPFAPKFSGSWMVAYTVKSGTVLTWRIENRLFASSRYFLAFNNDPNVAQHGYVREDLTVAIMGNAGWEILVSGQNLGNQTIRTYGAPQPVTLGTYAFLTQPPHSVAIQAKFDFN